MISEPPDDWVREPVEDEEPHAHEDEEPHAHVPEGAGRHVEHQEEDLARDLIRIAMRNRMLVGGSFVLDAPAAPRALWGDGDRILWAEGEPAMLFGPTGVGKTTLYQQVLLGRMGLLSEVLGFSVEPDDRPALYLACDRPAQAQRSLRRMVREEDRPILDAKLRVWKGPLPGDLSKNPDLLRMMAAEVGAGTLIVDSLKDIAHKLGDDETGTRVNNAFQECVSEGIQVGVLHHPRKAQGDNKKPNTIDDVYGSTWFTAGMGSVLCLWGKPGDAVVELSHLKQPAEEIEPLTVVHNHVAGVSSVEGAIDLLAIVRTSNGLTAEGAARAIFRKDNPTRNEVEKARYKLERLAKKDLAYPKVGGRDALGKQLPTRYFKVVKEAP